MIDLGIGSPGHGIEIAYYLNATKKIFLSMLRARVQLPGTESYE